ncbi:MAG: hypothetical protein ABL956_09170 [Hyphomonadaceae bacterium]
MKIFVVTKSSTCSSKRLVAEVLGAARLFRDNALAKRRIVVAFQRYGADIARQAGPGSGCSITTLDMSCRTAERLA